MLLWSRSLGDFVWSGIHTLGTPTQCLYDVCLASVLVKPSVYVGNSWFCCVMIPPTGVLRGCLSNRASTCGIGWLVCDATDVCLEFVLVKSRTYMGIAGSAVL